MLVVQKPRRVALLLSISLGFVNFTANMTSVLLLWAASIHIPLLNDGEISLPMSNDLAMSQKPVDTPIVSYMAYEGPVSSPEDLARMGL